MQCENANGSNKFGTFTIFWNKASLGEVIRMQLEVWLPVELWEAG